MKKLALLAVALTILLSASLPVHVYASGESCTLTGKCNSASDYCNIDGTCHAISETPTTSSGDSGGTLGASIKSLIDFSDAYLVPLIFAVAFIVFLWGVFQYFIFGAADEEKRKEGRNFIMYALIGFVLMFSIWGIVNLLYHSLGFDTGVRPDTPKFGTQ